MNLARFIQSWMDQLLIDFGEAALEIAPELRGKDSAALEDHAREMLEFVVEDLLSPQTTRESARKALGQSRSPVSPAAENHGTSRLGQGLSMLQTIQELRALRARVMKALGDSQQGLTTSDIHELLRFNESIDQLIVESLASYSALKEQEGHLLAAMLRVSPDPTAIFDSGGKLLYLNTPMADMAGTTAKEAVGKTPGELDLGFATELHEAITATVTTGKSQRRELHCLSPSGSELHFDCQLVPVFSGQNKVEAVAKTSRDITERKQAEHQVWRNANFDSLTGIPNRRLFLDQLGHSAGDRLLEQAVDRISTSVRAMDTFARLGGDEFTLILKDASREDAEKVAGVLLASPERPFLIDGHKVHVSGSMGLALLPGHGDDVDQLMHHADQAMYAAKQRGGHQVLLYQSDMEQRSVFTEPLKTNDEHESR